MPRRNDINKILIIGAGPIVIGQACEFDYSGVQACKALKEEGYELVLVNSNPATIMTDPSIADRTYVEPITWEVLAKIIAAEKPDALLPTMGGQTALNAALDLVQHGVLAEHNVELIGASKDAIDTAEDREQFRKAMQEIGLESPRSAIAHSIEEAKQVQAQVGFPTIIRPSFTMGGTGGGIAYNVEEFESICRQGLALSPTSELLIEESVIGWKEYELEVVRDKNDNCIIICAIENIDPMGVHTGDSITVAPAQTLTDKEYQLLRDAACKVLRKVGVETGGSNVQFALDPKSGRILVIEMNPRVSRSSALASKATGFPIAKVAAKLAVGYSLDELRNEITGDVTPASFEPSLDYVVVKIPRFDFDKFPQANARLTTQMKSVGEVMAIGRTFQAALQKAIRGLEIDHSGLEPCLHLDEPDAKDILARELKSPGANRIWYVADAFRFGYSLEAIQQKTGIDPWYLTQLKELIDCEAKLLVRHFQSLQPEFLLELKQRGFSDARIAKLLKCTEAALRTFREQHDIKPVYHRVDTTAGEYPSETDYLYSSYASFCEAKPSSNKKIMILGGGPNRIGQGIEFDYCCVHAAFALHDAGYETIMVNCNPETVSTDYDTADRLYFEALTVEDVYEIYKLEQPEGVLVQYGGQTPLKIAQGLAQLGVPIIGTSTDAIDRAEDRDRFKQLIDQLGLQQPDSGMVSSLSDAIRTANKISYPLMVRPSYVLGGRAMEIVHHDSELEAYLKRAFVLTGKAPILLDKYLEDAIEVDVDAICDGEQVFVAGIMQHIEQAGIHSGDSACSLPPYDLPEVVIAKLQQQMQALALELGVVGLMNAQFAIIDEDIWILEVNPRASRTVPFVSKATGIDLAKVAARCMVGESLAAQGIKAVYQQPKYFAVKEPVFPFIKFKGADPIPGPEMKSTGEVMGIADNFAEAYAKAQLAASKNIPRSGCVFLSVRDKDKVAIVKIAKRFIDLGFKLIATDGTARAIEAANIPIERVNKVLEGRPHVVDKLKNSEVDFIVNTTEGRKAIEDSFIIRDTALHNQVSTTMTISGAKAVLAVLEQEQAGQIYCLQDLF